MYAIYAYIDPPNYPNVGIYGIHGVSGYIGNVRQFVPRCGELVKTALGPGLVANDRHVGRSTSRSRAMIHEHVCVCVW